VVGFSGEVKRGPRQGEVIRWRSRRDGVAAPGRRYGDKKDGEPGAVTSSVTRRDRQMARWDGRLNKFLTFFLTFLPSGAHVLTMTNDKRS